VLRGAAGLGAGLAGALTTRGRPARAFGEVPPAHRTAMLPEPLEVAGVLELFLFGGLSQHESLYVVPDLGAPSRRGAADGLGWHQVADSPELTEALAACGLLRQALLAPFGAQADGRPVYLGPFAAPLRERPDLIARTRLCVVSHGAMPHEVAVPLALTGRSLGHPAMAGIAAHVQRHFRERDPGARAPHGYVLMPSSPVIAELARGASAAGAHPPTARPLTLHVGAATELGALLARPGTGAVRAAHDALVRANIERLRARLRWPGASASLRARRLDDLEAAALAVADADVVAANLPAALLAPSGGESCGAETDLDGTRASLRLAAHLLTGASPPARYVAVVDGGILPAAGAGGYDTHEENCRRQSRNVTHVLAALAEVIRKPGERDPSKIDLDETLVVVNTEFGRTPQGEGNGGRGHWPHAFPVLFIGGPVGGARTGAGTSGVFGAIDPAFKAAAAIAPVEHRIAVLMALGIWPFEPESFNVSDVPGAKDEPGAGALVRTRVLGVGA
jgi:hypothetical protein